MFVIWFNLVDFLFLMLNTVKNLLKSFGSMCFTEKCSDPSRKTNADVHGNEFYHGKEVQFSCTKDYTLVPASSKKLTCQDGDWRGTIPSCKGTIWFLNQNKLWICSS